MSLKNFLLDKRFSTLVWLMGLLCLSMSIVVLILFGILYSITNTMTQFLDIVKVEINLAILFFIAITVIFYGYILINFGTIRYISSPPDNSFASFEEMRNQVQELENSAKSRMPFLIFFGVLVGFCISYFIGGNDNDWRIALQLPVTIITSGSITLAAVSFFGIVVEVILLGLRYLIWFDSDL